MKEAAQKMRIEPNRPVNTTAVNQAAEAPSVQPPATGKAQDAKAEGEQQPVLPSVVEKMNQALHIFNPSLQFEMVDGHRIVVRVVDTITGEVIRQIPPEELLETYRKLNEALGVLIDRKV